MMKTFLLYLFLFLVGSMLGYLCEVLFRRFFHGEEMGESRIHERTMVAFVWVWNPLNVYDLYRF